MSEYSELLKSPLWKAKRKEILERDGYKCCQCGNTKYLQVHHKYYKYGLKPWEYDNACYITLCKTCHYKIHKEKELAEMPVLARDLYRALLLIANTNKVKIDYTKIYAALGYSKSISAIDYAISYLIEKGFIKKKKDTIFFPLQDPQLKPKNNESIRRKRTLKTN